MNTIYKITLLLLLITLSSCDNESTPSENENQCNYQGLSWVDSSDNTQIFISDSELSTQFFPNATNGPYGNPGVEIAGVNSVGQRIFFVTNVIDEGVSGSGKIILNEGDSQAVDVICQRASTSVGEEYRYDVVIANTTLEFEFCVVIDEVL